jgi:hypothetical protein
MAIKLKGILFHVHSMKTYQGSSGIAPLILNFGIKWRLVLHITPGHFTPREGARMPIERGGWALERVWMFFERRKFLNLIGIRTADRPGHSLSLYTDYTYNLGFSYMAIKTTYVAWDINNTFYSCVQKIPLSADHGLFLSLATEGLIDIRCVFGSCYSQFTYRCRI